MSKENLCWTCGKCMTVDCPKHKNLEIENKMWRTKVYECTEYEYDGECVYCVLNTKHERKRLYESCPHFIRNCVGCCAQENYMKMKQKKVQNG